jgi:predicted enzyme related to lactoylglutathione lyase
MSYVTENQPEGTPTWIDLGIPDLDRAMEFYGAVFGWEFDVGPPEMMRYTVCRIGGKAVAGLAQSEPTDTKFWWNVYLATNDCDATTQRIRDAGGTIVIEPMDVMDQGRLAIAKDTVGAQFGLWQGGALVGCELVNEPGALLRNDLVTPAPQPARAFYAEVFGFSLDGNPDMPEFDFTFLRRPDGHEIGGIMGLSQASSSAWGTLFEVADADETVAKIRAAGGTADDAQTMIYGRTADVKDPFGVKFTVGSRLPTQPASE